MPTSPRVGGIQLSGVVAARALDLDHLGAQVGEQHGGVGPARTREKSATMMPASGPMGSLVRSLVVRAVVGVHRGFLSV